MLTFLFKILIKLLITVGKINRKLIFQYTSVTFLNKNIILNILITGIWEKVF